MRDPFVKVGWFGGDTSFLFLVEYSATRSGGGWFHFRTEEGVPYDRPAEQVEFMVPAVGSAAPPVERIRAHFVRVGDKLMLDGMPRRVNRVLRDPVGDMKFELSGGATATFDGDQLIEVRR